VARSVVCAGSGDARKGRASAPCGKSVPRDDRSTPSNNNR